MITPRQGPTPVGQRNRATTIPSRRNEGPSADECWGDIWSCPCPECRALRYDANDFDKDFG